MRSERRTGIAVSGAPGASRNYAGPLHSRTRAGDHMTTDDMSPEHSATEPMASEQGTLQPATLRALLDNGSVWPIPRGLGGKARREWIVAGEDRLSYTTMVRLVECCREHHWDVDITPQVAAVAGSANAGERLDSITKSLRCEFLRPVVLNSVFSITYGIAEMRIHSYRLTFELATRSREFVPDLVCARFDMVCVFYDPIQQRAIPAPPTVAAALQAYAAGDA